MNLKIDICLSICHELGESENSIGSIYWFYYLAYIHERSVIIARQEKIGYYCCLKRIKKTKVFSQKKKTLKDYIHGDSFSFRWVNKTFHPIAQKTMLYHFFVFFFLI